MSLLKNKKGLIYFDLANFVKSQLKLNKVRKIDMINIDTFISNSFGFGGTNVSLIFKKL